MKFLNRLLNEQDGWGELPGDYDEGPDLTDLGWRSFDGILNKINEYLEKKYADNQWREKLVRRFKIFTDEEFKGHFFFYDPQGTVEKELFKEFNWISDMDKENFRKDIMKLGNQLDSLENGAKIFSEDEAKNIMR